MTTATFAPPDFQYGTPEDPASTQREEANRTFGATDGPQQMSAEAFVSSFFGDAFGGVLLEEVAKAYKAYLAGTPIQQVLYDLRQSDAYGTRFAGMKALRAKGRSISEGAYLDLERQYSQVARQFDLPPGFYDSPDDFAGWIGGEVAPVELQRRLTAWQTWERETRDPAAETAIREQFAAAGLVASEGDFLAAAIDPTKSIDAIERRLEAGLVSGAAARSGFGGLSIDQGLTLADRGVTRDQAEQGFGSLVESRELFAALPGEAGADTIGRDEQVSAAFLGDSGVRQRIERRARTRTAEFGGGGGGGLGRSGLAGLGGG